MRRTRALLLLTISLVCLGSCGLFFASPFPLTLSQTMVRRDFSAEVDTTVVDRFQPFVIDNGAARIVVLVGGYPYPGGSGDKPWLFVLREDLSTIASWNLDGLQTIAGGSFSGSGAVVDCSGLLVVGNVRFTFTADSVAPVGLTGDVGSRGGVGDRAFPSASFGENVAHLGTTGGNLVWDLYNCTWTWTAQPGVRIRTTKPEDLYLRAVLSPPYNSWSDVVLVLDENSASESTTYFVRVPRADFVGGLTPDFLDVPFDDYPVITRTDLETRSLGFTEEGITAYSYTSREYQLFSFGATDKPTTLWVGSLDGDEKESQRTSWSWSGGYSCVYDARTRTLSKVANWWN